MYETGKIKKIGWGFGICNMYCEHCYNSSDSNNVIPRYTFGQLVSVAEKVCPFVRDINFGTGELICNPNTLELIDYISNTYPQIDMSITSNGYTITKMDPKFIKQKLSDVDISIDFPDSKRHNLFRRNENAWDWAIRALEILRDIRLQRTITMCLTSKTTNNDIVGMLRLANNYGACLRINWYRKTGRGDEKLQITANRAWEIIKFLSDKVVFSSLDSVFAGPLGVKCQPCPAGSTSARIHQDMSITAYPFLKGQEWSAGNILDPTMTMEKIYESEIFDKLRKRKVPFCQSCEFKNTCSGGCVTRAILHNEGINDTDDFCPIRYKQMNTVNLLRGKVIVYKQGNLVHDGYLCTTIVKPNGDV